MNTTTLVTTLQTALDKLVTLKVITTVTGSGSPDVSIVTEINHVDGHITTSIDEKFVTGPYQGLRDFHSARETQAAGILKGNLEVVEKLVALLERTAKITP